GANYARRHARFGSTASRGRDSPTKRSSCALWMPCCPTCRSSLLSRRSSKVRKKREIPTQGCRRLSLRCSSRRLSRDLSTTFSRRAPMVMASTKARFGFPLEYVPDIHAAKRFFVDVLGLELERDH